MFICKGSRSRKKQTFRSIGQYVQTQSETLVVLVFKTSLQTEDDIACIKPSLESSPTIKEWSVDQDDPDNVLRVVGKDLQPEKIITMIKAKGYECEVLP